MAYNGYLISVSDNEGMRDAYEIPLSYMLEKTYKATYSALDLSSDRNATGVLVRNALDHLVAHCSVDIKPMWNKDVDELMSAIRSKIVVNKEKKLYVSMFVPELNDYVNAYCYYPDIEFTITRIDKDKNKVRYATFTLEFIGY